MTLYKNMYRIESARYKDWDYTHAAAYFITICTRYPYFGAISDGVMDLSPVGKIVAAEWVRTPDIRPDMNLTLDAFVVMPNHFHAIIIIGENVYNSGGGIAGGDGTVATVSAVSVETHCNASLPKPQPQPQFGPQRKNLASIVRGFKSAVTMQARIVHPGFAWQPRFHDHIIRDEREYGRISDYILNNPVNWTGDTFHSANQPAS